MTFLFDYFFDPVLQAPMIASLLIGATTALLGTFLLLKKQALMGEVLSHVAYPGLVSALFIVDFFFEVTNGELFATLLVFVFCVTICFFSVWVIEKLEKKYNVYPDSALSFTLVSFFGLGLLLLSGLQHDFPTLYKKSEMFLFGQAATMGEEYIYIYAALLAIVLLLLYAFLRPLRLLIFDPLFAEVSGCPVYFTQLFLFFLICFAIVVGFRACGVVLVSSMLIFPAVIALEFASTLKMQLFLAVIFSLLASFSGVVLSHEWSLYLTETSGRIISLPLGPMIVMSFFALFALVLLFSRRRGVLFRLCRKLHFYLRCEEENVLKAAWKLCAENEHQVFLLQDLLYRYEVNSFILLLLRKNGYLSKK